MGCGASHQPADEQVQQQGSESSEESQPLENDAVSTEPLAPVPVPGGVEEYASEARPSHKPDDSKAETVEVNVAKLEQLDSSQAQVPEAMPAPVQIQLVQSRLGISGDKASLISERFNKALSPGCTALDKDQFLRAMPELGMRAPLLVDRVFRAFDKNKDGHIDKNEFLAVMTSLCSDDETDKCRVVFSMYDSDNDGFVTKAELEQILRAYFGGRAAVMDQVVIVEDLDLEDEDLELEEIPLDTTKHDEALATITDFLDAIFAADENNDQLISFDELQNWLNKEGKSTIYGNELTKWIEVLVGNIGQSK